MFSHTHQIHIFSGCAERASNIPPHPLFSHLAHPVSWRRAIRSWRGQRNVGAAGGEKGWGRLFSWYLLWIRVGGIGEWCVVAFPFLFLFLRGMGGVARCAGIQGRFRDGLATDSSFWDSVCCSRGARETSTHTHTHLDQFVYLAIEEGCTTSKRTC